MLRLGFMQGMPACVCFFHIFNDCIYTRILPHAKQRKNILPGHFFVVQRLISPTLHQKSSKCDTTSHFWYSAASLTFSWLAVPSLCWLLGPPVSSLSQIQNVLRPAALSISEIPCFHATSPGSSPPSPSQTQS